MRVYLAGQYKIKNDLRIKADDLRVLGHTVTSSWLDEPYHPESSLKDIADYELRLAADRDLSDIEGSDLLVLFTVSEDTPTFRNGRMVELGFAIGRGIQVAVVGERENIFCHLLADDLVFENWSAFLEVISDEGWASS